MDKEIKIFIKEGIIFLVIIALCILIINAIYVSSILSQKTFYKKEMGYQEYAKNLTSKEIDLLFIGDSHTLYAVNPKFILNATSYNYGSGAENYVKSYYKLKNIVENQKISVENVVLQVDPDTFSGVLTDKDNLLSELEVYSKMIPFDEIVKIKGDFPLTVWLNSYVPVFGRGKEFGILIQKINSSELINGGVIKGQGNLSLLNKTEIKKMVDISYERFFKNKDMISNVSFSYFLKTLKLAQEHNITIIIIKYPYAKEFDLMLKEKNISLDSYYSIIFSKVNSTICGKYYVLDYYSLFAGKNEYFGDPEHINYIGSEVLSKRIYKDISMLNSSKGNEINCSKKQFLFKDNLNFSLT